MKSLHLFAAAVALLLSASAARADVGDLALVSFAGEVTKISTGSNATPDDFWITAKVIVKVTRENGEVTTGDVVSLRHLLLQGGSGSSSNRVELALHSTSQTLHGKIRGSHRAVDVCL